MLFRGLVLALLFLPGGARRSVRAADSRRDASVDSEALIPGVLGRGVVGRAAPATGVLRERFGAYVEDLEPGFAAPPPLRSSRPRRRAQGAQMREAGTRREALGKAAGAALAGAAAVQSASAKAGQFSKIEVFSLVGQPGISSPYQPGGPKSGPDATYGYQKSDGEFLAKGYQQDVKREKAAFEESKKIVSSQGPNIESKTWWLVRDNFRGQAYNMKANMLAINSVLELEKRKAANKAYDKFWKEVNDLDLACQKKELALAQAEYKSVLDALAKYEQIALA